MAAPVVGEGAHSRGLYLLLLLLLLLVHISLPGLLGLPQTATQNNAALRLSHQLRPTPCTSMEGVGTPRCLQMS